MKRSASPDASALKRHAAPPSTSHCTLLPTRVRALAQRSVPNGAVVYWMSRDQRVRDNWAFTYAQHVANTNRVPLAVVFCLASSFLDAPYRHFAFMLKGLKDVEKGLLDLEIPFVLLHGDCTKEVPMFVDQHRVSHVVTDFSPLRIGREWRERVSSACKQSSFYEVDAHNVVPVWVTSDKQETAARTIRKKIEDKVPDYLEQFPAPQQQSVPFLSLPKIGGSHIDWSKEFERLTKMADMSVGEVDWITPGEFAGRIHMEKFLTSGLKAYASKRNDPTESVLSNLSPYFHYGHVCTASVVLRARELKVHSSADFKTFFEESVVRKELSDNFCFYNKNYDRFEGFAAWAQETLTAHAKDRREFVYTQEEWDRADTHDPLWNAAQAELAVSGKMHGFMRMYWAKKILEWSATPQEALKTAIYLNDRYELDGRDPNGYVASVEYMTWVGRRDPYSARSDVRLLSQDVSTSFSDMNFAGCQRKFDVGKYIQKWKATNKDLRTMIKKKGT